MWVLMCFFGVLVVCVVVGGGDFCVWWLLMVVDGGGGVGVGLGTSHSIFQLVSTLIYD